MARARLLKARRAALIGLLPIALSCSTNDAAPVDAGAGDAGDVFCSPQTSDQCRCVSGTVYTCACGDVVCLASGYWGGTCGCQGFGDVVDIALTVVQYATPVNTALAGVFVRAEAPGRGFVDTKTDDMGVAHLRVNPAQRPFDITIALPGFSAVSILRVTDSIPGSVVLYPLPAPPTSMDFAVTGAITGTNAANRVQVSSWDWQTAVTMPGDMSYATKFQVLPGLAVPLSVAAIEVDPMGNAVNGVVTTPVARPSAATMIPIAMPSTPVHATPSTLKINWPMSGIFTADQLKDTVSAVTDPHIGGGFVAQLTTSDPRATRLVGIASVDLPMNGTSLLHLQTFGGPMAPDIAGAALTTVAPMAMATPTDLAATVYVHDLSAGSQINVEALTTFAVDGTSLGDATFVVDANGYDSAEIVIDAVQGAVSVRTGIIYVPGGRTHPLRGLPTLPASVTFADLGGAAAQAEISARVVKYVKNAYTPWQAIAQDQAFLVGHAIGRALAPTGR